MSKLIELLNKGSYLSFLKALTSGGLFNANELSVNVKNDLSGHSQSDTITLAASTDYDFKYADWNNVAEITISGIVGGTVTCQVAPDGITFADKAPLDASGAPVVQPIGNGSYTLITNGAIPRIAAGAGISAGTLGIVFKLKEGS